MNKMDIVLSAIRSVGASFPVASSIVNAWNEYASHLQAEKCDRLITNLAENIEALEGRIERTERECAEVFGLALNYALNDPNIDKMPVYAGLVTSYCDNTADKDTVSNLIYECETLLPFDLENLKRLGSNRRIDSAFGFNEQTSRKDVSKCQTSIKKLEAKGLIGVGGENSISFERMYENSSSWPFTFYTQYYIVLHQGQLLLKILQNADTQQAS